MSERHFFKIEKDNIGQRLDVFCSNQVEGVSRSRVKELIFQHRIRVNDNPVKPSYKVQESDIIDMFIPDPINIKTTPEDIPLDIRYQDDDLVIVNKAPGMVVHPATGNYTGTMVNALLYHVGNLSGISGELKPGIVHRLDKNTSGLLIVAKNDTAHQSLAEQIKTKTAKRLYKAIVLGNLPEDEGILSFPIGRSAVDRKKMAVSYSHSKEATTRYEVLERYHHYTLAQIQLHTGRTHQIRVHLSHCGYPVLGDPEYKGRRKPIPFLQKEELDLWRKLLKILKRQALHAFHLEFRHPTTGKTMTITCDIPEDMQKALDLIHNHYRER
ncbi:MAG: RluA family pseudouridine synthase [candidate division Zixibacteria bacterium]|nr:RluA family pseudouridine synthase [candidate division Zixibacteria bacterium]